MGSGVSSAIFNLTTTIIGAGIMALAAPMKVLGLVLGNFLDKPARSYGEVVQIAMGRTARVLSEICIIVNNAGVLIVYLIIMGDVMSGSVHHIGVFDKCFQIYWSNNSYFLRFYVPCSNCIEDKSARREHKLEQSRKIFVVKQTSVLQMQRVRKSLDIIRDQSQASPNKPSRKHFQFNQDQVLHTLIIFWLFSFEYMVLLKLNAQFCHILLRCIASLAVSLILVQVGTCKTDIGSKRARGEDMPDMRRRGERRGWVEEEEVRAEGVGGPVVSVWWKRNLDEATGLKCLLRSGYRPCEGKWCLFWEYKEESEQVQSNTMGRGCIGWGGVDSRGGHHGMSSVGGGRVGGEWRGMDQGGISVNCLQWVMLGVVGDGLRVTNKDAGNKPVFECERRSQLIKRRDFAGGLGYNWSLCRYCNMRYGAAHHCGCASRSGCQRFIERRVLNNNSSQEVVGVRGMRGERS
ncbi:hypothetical protein GOBAR_AA22816 [Gossypium barbadense]|uniref:Uncharacterized protein n=1 Tax=Gossypium barbadense TaxID=3634 RepID=A0A2P5X3E7_GOSBA|nr:hypothetical protein GOBAR_AA22816 [Gossypium barbadense]